MVALYLIANHLYGRMAVGTASHLGICYILPLLLRAPILWHGGTEHSRGSTLVYLRRVLSIQGSHAGTP